MAKIVGVQFQKDGKMFYFDANGFDPAVGEYVIADTSRGYDLGQILMAARDQSESEENIILKKIIRLATDQDIQHSRDNRAKEKDAYSICQKKISEHNLEMKLVSVEYAFDNSKILFFFTANGRVDFRSLVKDLASIFKMRIELRQIGVRDEAKMLGGLGPCGRPICCGTFLDQFQPVSIKMAKEQNLSLNPTKISGVCGRLMCCLKYEQEHYELTRKKMPKVGREVITPDGKGTVTDLNIVKETVFVRMTNGDTSEIKEYPLENITRTQDGKSHSENSEIKNESVNESVPENEKSPTIKAPYSDANEYNDEVPENKPVQPAARTQNNTTSEKNRDKNRKAVLGQPVRRENPNKKTEAPEAKQLNTRDAEKPVKETSSHNSWAEALEKAMQAIDRDK